MNPDRKYFEYNGKKSSDFGVWINGDGTFAGAEPDIESIEIPGRNGSLTLWNGRYRNVSVYYRCFITRYFSAGAFAIFRNWLLSEPGYHKLVDGYQTGYFRQARVLSGLDISSIDWKDDTGSFTVRFDCMPQRFTDAGDTFQEIYDSGDFIGDFDLSFGSSPHDTKPIIATRGYGKITIDYGDDHENPISFTIAQNSFTYNLYTDCESENCYANVTTMINRNSYLTLDDGKFPILKGNVKNYITFDNTFSSVKVKPRYFRL